MSIFLTATVSLFAILPGAAPDDRLFRHSDVIAFTRGSLHDYRSYHVNFVSWGGYPTPDAKSVEAFRQGITQALTVGTRIGAKVGTRTDFRGFIDLAPDDWAESRCITVEGKPIIVPDMLTVQYKGHPAYWFCTNSPKFREYLKRNVTLAMKCQPFGIHMDDPLGTAAAVNWFGGCYCKWCCAALRDDLKRRFSPEELKSKGIDYIDRFDLRAFHMPLASVSPVRRPLRAEIQDFQSRASAEMFRQVMAHALRERGQRVPVSGNIGPAIASQGRLILEVDYYCCECGMGAEKGDLDKGMSLLTYKLADALGRPAAIMGSGGDHAFVQAKHLPSMVRCWVAEAYAFGNYFCAPYRLWAYTKEKGSHHYSPRDKTELAPLYDFIKGRADLLDGCSAPARVGVVHSYALFRREAGTMTTLVRELADRSIPFQIVIAGDEQVPTHLDPKQLARFDVLLVPPSAVLAAEDAAAVERFRAGGRKVVQRVNDIPEAMMIRVDGASRVRATLRLPDQPSRPAALHLLNRDYDLTADQCRTAGPFTVRLPRSLLSGKAVRQARYIAAPRWPGKDAADGPRPPVVSAELPLPVTERGDHLEIVVPRLDLWGILVLM